MGTEGQITLQIHSGKNALSIYVWPDDTFKKMKVKLRRCIVQLTAAGLYCLSFLPREGTRSSHVRFAFVRN